MHSTAKIVRSKKIQNSESGVLCGKRFLRLIFPLFFWACKRLPRGQDFSKVEIKVPEGCRHGVHATGRGGNIGVRWAEDGIVVVDDEFFPGDKIEAALKGITDKPVKFILNTHWQRRPHGGNPHFGAKAPIIAQENVRKRLATGGQTRFGKVEPAGKVALPVITFEEDVTVHLNGEDIRAIHFPTAYRRRQRNLFSRKPMSCTWR